MMRAIPLTTIRGGINRLRTKGGARPDVLYDLVNGYRTDSGTVKSRPGTTREHTLDSLTRGLVGFDGGLHTFCHESVEVPEGVTLHVLQYPRDLEIDPVPLPDPTFGPDVWLVQGTSLSDVRAGFFADGEAAAWTDNTSLALSGIANLSQATIDESGTHLIVYLVDNVTKVLRKFTLSTPFDLTTATEDVEVNFPLASDAHFLEIDPSGTTLFVGTIVSTNPVVLQFDLAGAYDLTGIDATSPDATLVVESITNREVRNIQFTPDGSQIIVYLVELAFNGEKVMRTFDVSTPWTLAGATLASDLDVKPLFASTVPVYGARYRPDGTKLFGITQEFSQTVFYSIPIDPPFSATTPGGTGKHFFGAVGSASLRINQFTIRAEEIPPVDPNPPATRPDERTLEKIHFAQPFMGALYVAAEFDDGAIYHYWLQQPSTWEGETAYARGSFVEPTDSNGLVFEATRLGSPYPSWGPNVPRTADPYDPSIVEPTEYNDFYYTCVETAGTNPISGTVEPDWPTEDGARVSEDVDGSEITIATPTEPSTVDTPQQSVIDQYANWYAAARAGITP